MNDVYSLALESLLQSGPTLIAILITVYVVRTTFSSYLDFKKFSQDKYRRDLELEIAKLNDKMTISKERFENVNHLILDGNRKKEVFSEESFLEQMGIFSKPNVKPKSVFVLTPFNNDYDKDYQWVKSAFSKHKYTCSRGDDVKAQSNLLPNIIREMLSSQFVVANISGRNPNVFYELGIAHALGKDVILVARSEQDITFDLSSTQVVIYKKQEELESSITEWLVSILESKIKS